jgi:hypothetical protein
MNHHNGYPTKQVIEGVTVQRQQWCGLKRSSM